MTVSAAALPSIQALVDSPPPSAELAPYLVAPPPPETVATAIADDGPRGWEQFDSLRTELLDAVMTTGVGDGHRVTAAQVANMLAGGHADPLEIVLTTALLARWSGAPSRVGFGYDGGFRVGDALVVSADDASAWTEVFFEGLGWLPVIGTPRRADSDCVGADS